MTETTTKTTAPAPADAPRPLAPADAERRDALTGRLSQATLGMMDLLTVYLGDRLDLYRALAEGGPATPAELAARTGTQERYVREWLEQQATGALLDVEATDDVEAFRSGEAPPPAQAERRRYRLPAGHAEVLTDRDSLNYLAYLGRFATALGGAAPAVVEAFRSGAGVSWSAMGADLREGQGEQNRPIFLNLLGRQWLPTMPDLHARLLAGGARVADVACGAGWSSIAIAKAYPGVRVDGFDLDAPSVDLARANAAGAGVSDRVQVSTRDAADPALAGRYDLVLICEALHDVSDPIGVLRTMRRLVAPEGTVLVVDERVAEDFTAPGDDLERMMYGFSVLCCLPNGMASQPSAATGTVMRPALLRRYATAAGFGDVEILPVEHDLFRLYRLT